VDADTGGGAADPVAIVPGCDVPAGRIDGFAITYGCDDDPPVMQPVIVIV
jgi:hypothetical protein